MPGRRVTVSLLPGRARRGQRRWHHLAHPVARGRGPPETRCPRPGFRKARRRRYGVVVWATRAHLRLTSWPPSGRRPSSPPPGSKRA